MENDKLHVGVYQGNEIPQSFRVYAENVQKCLPQQDVKVVSFSDKRNVPRSADVLWDIRSGGGNPPPEFLMENDCPPLVVTVHGFAPITLNGWEYFRTMKGVIMSHRYARDKYVRWQEAKAGVAGVIAVSAFVKEEAIKFTGVHPDKIYVCHHGADNEIFTPYPERVTEGYFFHISNGEPRKNIKRLLEAFRRLRRSYNVQLVLKLPESAAREYVGVEGVRVIAGLLTTAELADLYRGAIAFVFPSLYEGFGMPILEAMACGCPVITSNASACPEVAGDVGVVVDPRDEAALLNAMLMFCEKPEIRADHRAAGMRRVKDFSWAKSARCHAQVLRNAAQTRH